MFITTSVAAIFPGMFDLISRFSKNVLLFSNLDADTRTTSLRRFLCCWTIPDFRVSEELVEGRFLLANVLHRSTVAPLHDFLFSLNLFLLQ